MRSKPGRPKLPEAERRATPAFFYVSQRELTWIDAGTERAGISRSEWLRRRALADMQDG